MKISCRHVKMKNKREKKQTNMFLIDKKKRKEKNSVIYQWVIKVKVQTGKLRIFQENI